MQQKLFYIFLLILFGCAVHIQQAFAGGGRFHIQSSPTAVVGSQNQITATLYSPYNGDNTVSGEHVELRIDNPRSGDTCSTDHNVSDTNGSISGFCTAQTPGQLSIYFHSLDQGDDSSRVLVTFFANPTPTPTPTTQPFHYYIEIGVTPSPTPQISQTAKTSLDTNKSVVTITPSLSPDLTSSSSPTAKPTNHPKTTSVKKQFVAGLTAQNISIYFSGILIIFVVFGGLLHFFKKTKDVHPHEVISKKIEKQEEKTQTQEM